jgi:hypothetical protein
MARESAAIKEILDDGDQEGSHPISQFEFMVLDDTFVDPKTQAKIPVEFSFEGVFLRLFDSKTYNPDNLPAAVDIPALVSHLNSRPGYPTYTYRDVTNDDGVVVGKESVQTGWRPRFRCVNMVR